MGKKLTRDEFIEKARAIHGDKYGYDEVEYINNSTKVKIWCTIHKEYFYQTPNSHLLGKSCKKCGYDIVKSKRSMTLNEFIEKANLKYGVGKFDYSLVDIKNTSTPVIIICKEHGKFSTTPNTFLSKTTKHGCYKCSKENTIRNIDNKTLFIEKANALYNNKFDYSKVEYINNATKVEIICPEHGSYLQTPYQHLRSKKKNGTGCPSCGQLKRAESRRMDFLEFKDKATSKFNGKYIYDDIKYTDLYTPIEFNCPEHGIFITTPYKHLYTRYGCPKCSNKAIGNSKRSTKEEFIKKAEQKHNFKYDYSKVDYKGNKIKVEILCPIHGSFYQKPNDHYEHGCKYCAQDSMTMSYADRYKDTPTLFYVIKYKGKFKIGITTKNISERYIQEVKDLNEIEIIHSIKFDKPEGALELEKILLDTYQHYRYRGKNIFLKTNNTEVFNSDVYSKYLKEQEGLHV